MGYINWFYHQLSHRPPPIPSSISLKGQTIIITGANSGIGLEAARQCVRLNTERLILAVRSESKGEAARVDITKSNPDSQTRVEVWIVDFESFESVLSFGKRAQGLAHLDIAMLNAGAFKFEWITSSDGLEASLQVNHLSTALLSLLLLPVLRKTALIRKKPPRLTFTSTELHMLTPFKEQNADNILEYLNEKQHLKGAMDRYSVTKLLNVFWALQMVAEISSDVVTINLINPGSVASGLHRDNKAYDLMDRIIGRTPEEAARLLLNAAIVQGDETHGKYLSEARLVAVSTLVQSEQGIKLQKKLWNETRETLGKHLPVAEVDEAFSYLVSKQN